MANSSLSSSEHGAVRGRVENLLKDFYQRVFDDVMIGYLFLNSRPERLIEKESEMLLELLGEKVRYSGRPMAELHLPLKLQSGHFDRRMKIMEECLDAHPFTEEEKSKILSHGQSLRAIILASTQHSCIK